jgi:hypothetical protein
VADTNPAWLTLSDRLMGSTIKAAHDHLRARQGTNLTVNLSGYLATIHFAHCLDGSIDLNRDGRHAPALCLIRQCVEALTIVDLGLQPIERGDPLLNAWERDEKTHGEIRAILERDVWPSYGSGLWDEPWAEFFGNLARAVQPYAHYTPQLQRWQFAIPPGAQLTTDRRFLARTGMNVYDPEKASRITLFHSLLAWVLGRLLVANDCGTLPASAANDFRDFGVELSRSRYLDGPASKWPEQFWPHIFFKAL